MTNVDTDWVKGAVQARAAIADLALPQVSEIDAAYPWQDAYVASVAENRGGVGGFKLAVNGAAQMAHFGVSEPVSARIFGEEIYSNGAVLPDHAFSSLTIEPELAAILGPAVAELSYPVDRNGALWAIKDFHAAIELIDQRGISIADARLSQAVALNVFNAGIVLGGQSIAPHRLDVAGLSVSLRIDGEVVGETTGTAPQDPVEAVTWLLNHLHGRNITVTAGMVVMCGTHMPMRTLEPGTRAVEVAMSGLGTVSFSLGQ
ncbi:MAG: fumarylacetoacetate hydrolase family protein [Pseudomonadota bacterium]